MSDNDKAEIDALSAAFFKVFVTDTEKPVNLDKLYELFIPQGQIIKNVGSPAVPEVCDLAQFIELRLKLLNDGSLQDFYEQELSARTEIFGNIAQRFCTYLKSGVLNGQSFQQKGMKTMQFVRTTQGWKLAAVAWDDEREGLSLADAQSFTAIE